MANARWDQYRSEIERLFLSEGKPLKEVMAILKTTQGFHASKAQYERKLRLWGISKNRRDSDWKAIAHKDRRRALDGKESEVYIDGVLCPPTKLRKELARHSHVSTIERLWGSTADAPSPPTPDGIVICSPAQLDCQMLCDEPHPWVQFRKSLQIQHIQEQQRWIGFFSSSNNVQASELQMRIVDWNGSGTSAVVESSARTAKMLSMVMPQEHDDQHLEMAERLCSLPERLRVPEAVLVHLFLLSNNLFFQHDHKSTSSHDKQITRMLQTLGMDDFEYLRRLLSTRDTKAMAISEKLVASVLRSEDLEMLRIILAAGVDPNVLIEVPPSNAPKLFSKSNFFEVPSEMYGLLSPLEFAASLSHPGVSLEMSWLLLSYNASIERESKKLSALGRAFGRRHKKLVTVLIDAGARVGPRTFMFAAATGDEELLQIALDAGADVNSCLPDEDHTFGGYTALGVAVSQNNVSMTRTLLESGADVNAPQAYFLGPRWTTVLGLSARTGNLKLTKLLLEARASVNPPVDSCRSPLEMACIYCNFEIAGALLDAGADVPSADLGVDLNGARTTLLDKIIPLWDDCSRDLCRSVLARGAQYTSRTLIWAIKKDDMEAFSLILKYKDTASMAPMPIHAAFVFAIEHGRLEIAKRLRKAGALMVQDVNCIGNMKTLYFLRQAGILEDIIHRNGARILSAAILAADENFVELLLSKYNIDVSQRDPLSTSPAIPTALDAAALTGDRELAISLVSRGAPITDNTLISAVWFAVRSREAYNTPKTALLDYLLDLLQDEKEKRSLGMIESSTAIDMAISSQSLEVVQLLLNAGVDPTKPIKSRSPYSVEQIKEEDRCQYWWIDDYERTTLPVSALKTAAETNGGSMLSMLLTSARWDEVHIGIALTTAVIHQHYDIVPVLLAAGPNLDSTLRMAGGNRMSLGYCEYRACLEAAVETRQVSLVKDLIKAGASVDYLANGDYARTALQRAVNIGDSELMDILIDAGADVNAPIAKTGGATPLQLASIHGYFGIMQKLFDFGADVNADGAEFEGRTALEGAAEYGRIDALHLLLTRGAVINGTGRRQFIRAVKYAEVNGHNAAARLLRSFGGWDKVDATHYDQELDGYQEVILSKGIGVRFWH